MNQCSDKRDDAGEGGGERIEPEGHVGVEEAHVNKGEAILSQGTVLRVKPHERYHGEHGDQKAQGRGENRDAVVDARTHLLHQPGAKEPIDGGAYQGEERDEPEKREFS